jgi:hypothetical protein
MLQACHFLWLGIQRHHLGIAGTVLMLQAGLPAECASAANSRLSTIAKNGGGISRRRLVRSKYFLVRTGSIVSL